MNDKHHFCPSPGSMPGIDVELIKHVAELFLDPTVEVAQVELVDDPDAWVEVLMQDILTELLCEV